jgi:hypothetical protein
LLDVFDQLAAPLMSPCGRAARKCALKLDFDFE